MNLGDIVKINNAPVALSHWNGVEGEVIELDRKLIKVAAIDSHGIRHEKWFDLSSVEIVLCIIGFRVGDIVRINFPQIEVLHGLVGKVTNVTTTKIAFTLLGSRTYREQKEMFSDPKYLEVLSLPVCTCDWSILTRLGCQCGAFQKEQEYKKLIGE